MGYEYLEDTIMQDKPLIRASAMMVLIGRVEKAIQAKYGNPNDITRYMERWQKYYNNYNGSPVKIHYEYDDAQYSDDRGHIHLQKTLDNMDEELVLEIAVDLELEVPGLIYRVTEIKELLPENYKDVGVSFSNAHKKVYSEPAAAIVIANSTLESIIIKICEHDSIKNCEPQNNRFNLVLHILEQFDFSPKNGLNEDIQNIGLGLLTTARAIKNIRNKNTEAHGKLEKEIITDPIYAMLVVNSISTIGLFLLNYYAKHYEPKFFEKPKPVQPQSLEDDEIPF